MKKSDHFRFSKVLLATLASTSLLAASASGGSIKVLGQAVQGVPNANPVAISDSGISAGFSLSLQQQGQDLLENPSDSGAWPSLQLVGAST